MRLEASFESALRRIALVRRFEIAPGERRKILRPEFVLPELRRQTARRGSDADLRRRLHELLGDAPPGASQMERFAPEQLCDRVARRWKRAGSSPRPGLPGARTAGRTGRAGRARRAGRDSRGREAHLIEIILLDEAARSRASSLKVTLRPAPQRSS
jgi:hypothetical protein